MRIKHSFFSSLFSLLFFGIIISLIVTPRTFAFSGEVTQGGYLGSNYGTLGASLDVSHFTFGSFSPTCSGLETGWRFELHNDTQSFDIFNDTYDNGHFNCSGGIGSIVVEHGGTVSTDNISLAIYDQFGSDSWFSASVPMSSFAEPSPTPTATPTPTGTQVKIEASPTNGSKTIGQPFTVDVKVNSASDSAFNAARATVSVSSNLSVTGIHTPTSNACNLQYTKQPTTSNPSFAGAIYGDSSDGCTVYTMTLTPTSTGTGTVTFTNGSVKAYEDNSEILDGVTNASFTLGDGPTPTPTSALDFAITSPVLTYKTNFDLTGTKLSSIISIFVNGSDEDSEYPSSTTWEVPVTLSLGDNLFTIYGSDGSNSTASQTIHVNRHTLGDINGDGEIDLIDASLFAIDWDKTEDLTYILSDMNDDGNVDLTDLSILAKLQ